MAKYNGKVKLSVNFKPIVWLLENLNELIERINNINIDTGDIEDLENTLKNLYAHIKNVEEASKQSDKVLSDLINSNTTFLQNQINNIKTSISELETLVNTNKTDIESINEKINNINQSLTNINNSISDINGKINTINTNIANNTTDISELESRVSTNESNIISNSNRITALENFPFTKNLKLIGGEGRWKFNFTQNFDVTIELNDPSLGDLTGAYLIAYEFIDLGQNIIYSPQYLSKYGYFYLQLGYDSESEIIRNNIHFHWEKTAESVPFRDSDNIYFMGIITRLNNVVQ